MKVKIKTRKGYNIVSSYEIEEFIATKVMEVPGVVKITSKSYLRKLLTQISSDKHYGLEVIYLNKNSVGINVYVILASELNINDITNSIQGIVKYTLEDSFGLKAKYVDVYVRGIK